MKKQISRFSNSISNQRLRQAFLEDPELVGELIDAAICNGIASDLYGLRKQAGITQGELADLLGIKQSNISRWETPGYQGYKVKMISKIVRSLGGRLSIKIRPLTTYSYHLRFSEPILISSNQLYIDTYSHVDSWVQPKQEEYRFEKKGFEYAKN